MSTVLVPSKGKGTRRNTKNLEPEVQTLLRECERRIDAAQEDAWHALRTIHDDKLYKSDGYGSFKEYVEQRWGYSKSRAYQMIDHAKIIDYLKSEGVGFLPGGEGLTRPISKLRRKYGDDDEQFLQAASEVWRASSDRAPKAFDVPQVTVQHVESTMESLGIHRNVKKVSPNAVAVELRDLIAKLSQCDALKMTPKAFAAQFGDKGCPSQFFQTVDWLTDYAGVVGVKT
jgi:hypothetical protein